MTKRCYDRPLGDAIVESTPRSSINPADVINNQATSLKSNSSGSLNWCSTNNPKGRNICSPVKNQRQCGSCWAFSTADTIEGSVSYASGKKPTQVSVQQFPECSKN